MASSGLAHLLVASKLEGHQLEVPRFPPVPFYDRQVWGSPHGGLMVPVLKEHLPLSHSPDEALVNPSSGGVCGKEGRGSMAILPSLHRL